MAWDVGEAVAVTGQAWKAAWRLGAGVISREGDINQRIDGAPLRVVGRYRRTTTGIAAVSVGLEVQNKDRTLTSTVLTSLALGAANSWVEFDLEITPDPAWVWARPYIITSGSGGNADFGGIDIRRAEPPPLESVDTPQMVAQAVLALGIYRATGLITAPNQSASSGTGWILVELAFTVPSDVTAITLDFQLDQQTSGTNTYELVAYLDAFYADSSGTPVGPGLIERFYFNEASSASARKRNRFEVDITVTPGPHVVRLYARNTSGGGMNFYERRLKVSVARKSAL